MDLAHPNAVSELDALEARFGIPVIYTFLLSAISRRKGCKLAIKALYILVFGRKWIWAGCRKGFVGIVKKLLTFYAERAGMLDKHR